MTKMVLKMRKTLDFKFTGNEFKLFHGKPLQSSWKGQAAGAISLRNLGGTG